MRFTVVTTGRFSLDRAFGFRLAASSQIQLSVVNSPIRPAGLAPAWQPASPAHTRKPKLAASERKEHKAGGLIRNGEWRQIFSAEMIPPLRSLRSLRSFVAIQFRRSGSNQ